MTKPAKEISFLHYVYSHTTTEATTGYFSCDPEPALDFASALRRLEITPQDEFLHRYVLRLLCMQVEHNKHTLLAQAAHSPVLYALLTECALLNPAVQDVYDAQKIVELLDYTPLPHLRWSLQPDKEIHAQWSKAFAANIVHHHTLPHPEEEELPPLYDAQIIDAITARMVSVPSIGALRTQLLAAPALASDTAWERPPAQETAARALNILLDNGIIAGVEMRHEASLSPIALLRKWHLDMRVEHGALRYTVQGECTTYGRGLSLADARASYAMEMIERASAYASVMDNAIVGTMHPMPLLRGTYAELVAQGYAVLDPHTLPLEAPARNISLHWLKATAAGQGSSVLVPAQAVYLFCNLDEPALFMAPGSTGLATGNTLAEAKVAALLEIIERDAEAVTPYTRTRCFTLQSRDARIQSLLDDYLARGINIHCMDITTEFGVPCYQCFVLGHKGEVHRGTGAHLSGSRAVLSALTEVPYPYPYGPPSGAGLRGLPMRILEDLPDYAMKESPLRQLALLEAVLCAHGRIPLYVEITRKDLEFPVVRAIVPGLELHSDLDMYSRVSERLYANYQHMFQKISN